MEWAQNKRKGHPALKNKIFSDRPAKELTVKL